MKEKGSSNATPGAPPRHSRLGSRKSPPTRSPLRCRREHRDGNTLARTITTHIEALTKASVLRKVGTTGVGTYYTLDGKGRTKGSNGPAAAQGYPHETGQEGDKEDMRHLERRAESVKPVFIDNRDGNTLARAIKAYLSVLRSEGGVSFNSCSLIGGVKVNVGFVLHGTVHRPLVKNHRVG